MTKPTCNTDSCHRAVYFRGKCYVHYVRVGPQRRGTCKITPQDASLAERLEFGG